MCCSATCQRKRDGADTAQWVEEAGRRAVRAPGDLCDEGYCTSLVDRAFAEFGRLDILVNNAAFQRTSESIADITTADFDATFRTNVYAMFWLCRAALPRMEAGGAIINNASIQAYDPSPQLLAYAATKGAIVNFTKGLSQFAMRQGVRVNAVAPGPVWTPLIPSTMDRRRCGSSASRRRSAGLRSRSNWRRSSCSLRRTKPASSPARSTAPPVVRLRSETV